MLSLWLAEGNQQREMLYQLAKRAIDGKSWKPLLRAYSECWLLRNTLRLTHQRRLEWAAVILRAKGISGENSVSKSKKVPSRR